MFLYRHVCNTDCFSYFFTILNRILDHLTLSSFGGAGNILHRTKIRYGPPPAILGTPFIPKGQYEPGLSPQHISQTEGRGLEGAHLVFHPIPGRRRGVPGGARWSAGGAAGLGDGQG